MFFLLDLRLTTVWRHLIYGRVTHHTCLDGGRESQPSRAKTMFSINTKDRYSNRESREHYSNNSVSNDHHISVSHRIIFAASVKGSQK